MNPTQVITIRPDMTDRTASDILPRYWGIAEGVVDRVSVIRERVPKSLCVWGASYGSALNVRYQHGPIHSCRTDA